MVPFPPSKELQFLLEGDAWVDQVTIHTSGVEFSFANGCRVQANTIIAYVDEHCRKTVHDREWFDEGPVVFHQLLETPLFKVETEGFLLTLTFEGGRQLIVHSDEQPYEAGAVLGPPESRVGFYF